MQTSPNNIFGLINDLKRGNPQQIFNNMMNGNPRFAQFVRDNQGMSPNQIAQKYGVNIGAINNLMK